MTKKNLEAKVVVIDPLEQERRYKVEGPNGREYELKRECQHWVLRHNNNPVGSINTGSVGSISVWSQAQEERSCRAWKEIGVYEHDRSGSYRVATRENFESHDKSKGEEIHPLDYLLRAVALPETLPAPEANAKPLTEPPLL